MNREELAEYFRSLATTLEGEDYIDYVVTGYQAEAYIKVMKRGDVEDNSQVPAPKEKRKKVVKDIKTPELKEVTTPVDEAKGRQVFVANDGNIEVTVNKGGNK